MVPASIQQLLLTLRSDELNTSWKMRSNASAFFLKLFFLTRLYALELIAMNTVFGMAGVRLPSCKYLVMQHEVSSR